MVIPKGEQLVRRFLAVLSVEIAVLLIASVLQDFLRHVLTNLRGVAVLVAFLQGQETHRPGGFLVPPDLFESDLLNLLTVDTRHNCFADGQRNLIRVKFIISDTQRSTLTNINI